jgi:glycosyltransferase involved in cell wall biosynthesis
MMLTLESGRTQFGVGPSRHISVVTETYRPEINGVALTLGRLVDGLRDLGHLVTVVRPRRLKAEPRSRRQDDDAARAGVTVVPGIPIPGVRGVQFGMPSAGRLRRLWQRERPDVVYVATEGPLGWCAVRVAKRAGIPVFSGFHTNFHSYSVHYRFGWLRTAILRYLTYFHGRTRGTIVASLDLADRLRELGLERISVLGRGVDNRLFNPTRRCAALRREWGVGEDDLVAISVGRIAPEKNLELAVKAFRAMQIASPSVRLVIVGDGPSRASLQKQHPDIVFAGVQTGDQLARHYASADVFLFPSETDTFGNVTLEALASGLAVVAYDYAAAHQHISHGETGLLAPLGDAQAFIHAAASTAMETGCARAIGLRARTSVNALDWPSVVERFLTILLPPGERERSAHAA